jgi:REP element-mobilizing transposase RayT
LAIRCQPTSNTNWPSSARNGSARASVSDAEGEAVFRELIQRAETWLDQGFGSCVLNKPDAANEVVKSLHHFDGERYELDCYVVMANHVHLLMRPLNPNEHSVESILGGWKGFTARQIHELLGGSGPLWEQECFDRIVRDLEHLYRCIQYIGRNPHRAGRTREECHLWIRPEWEQIGWRFESE